MKRRIYGRVGFVVFGVSLAVAGKTATAAVTWVGTTGNWATESNWSNNAIPSGANDWGINNSGTAIIDSVVPDVNDVLLGWPTGNDKRGNLEIQTGGSLTTTTTDGVYVGVRATNPGLMNTLTISGGTLNLSGGGDLTIGDEGVGGNQSHGTVDIYSGSLTVGGNLRVGVKGEGNFIIHGNTPTINVAGNLTFHEVGYAFGRLGVEIGAGGISPINVAGNTNLDNAPELIIALSALVPQTDLVLINSSATSTPIPVAETFSGLPNGASVSATFGLSTYNWNINYYYGANTNDVALVFQSVVTEPVLLTGDVNGDNVVNQLDLNVVFGNWLSTEAALAQGDANGDGVINQLDINTITGNWLATASVGGGLSASTIPEPGSLILLSFGMTGLVRNRRRRAKA